MSSGSAPAGDWIQTIQKQGAQSMRLFFFLFTLALLCVVGCGPRELLIEAPPILEDDTLEKIGAAFRLYADDVEGEWFPSLSSEPGVFRPDMTHFRRYFDNSDEGQRLVDCLEGRSGIDFCYLGFMVLTDEAGLELLDAYEEMGPVRWRDADVELRDRRVQQDEYSYTSTIYRLRTGVPRFIIHEISDPTLYYKAEAQIPILWEMPAPPQMAGGWVLYMDGHKEWREYPGEFPMTEVFISQLRELMRPSSSSPSERSDGEGERNASAAASKTPAGVSPVHEIAVSVLEQLSPSPEIQSGNWRTSLVARTMSSWRTGAKTIVQCDEEPSVQVGGRHGYRVVFRKTTYERSTSSNNPAGTVRGNARRGREPLYTFSPHYAHIELVLFPSPPVVSKSLKKKIPWYDYPNEDAVFVVDMGEGKGYHWFGRMTVPQAFGIREAMKLSGGDDPFTLAKKYLPNAKDREEESMAYHLLALSGERAIPDLLKAVEREKEHPEIPIGALAFTRSPKVFEILLSLHDSDDEKVSRTATQMILNARQPEAKAIYLEILENPEYQAHPYYMNAVAVAVIEFGWEETKGTWLDLLARKQTDDDPLAGIWSVGMPSVYTDYMPFYGPGKVAVHFGWQEAIPLLETHCLEATSIVTYRAAYELRREVEGHPVPETLTEAERVIRDMAEYGRPFSVRSTPEEVDAAKKTFLACPDKEAVAIVALGLAWNPADPMVKRVGEPRIEAVGIEIARQLPREAVVYHLQRLGKLAEQGLPELRKEFLESNATAEE